MTTRPGPPWWQACYSAEAKASGRLNGAMAGRETFMIERPVVSKEVKGNGPIGKAAVAL